MATSPSTESILPRYSISAPIAPPPHPQRESVYAIIASYALPSKRPPKIRAPPPPALHLVPAHETSRTRAVQYPPSPRPGLWQGTSPLKWEWTASVGGAEEGTAVGEEGKGTAVSSGQDRAEGGASAKSKRETFMHRDWEPTLDGPRISLLGAVGALQLLLVTTTLLLLVIVLCSPLRTSTSVGLLVITLNDRVLDLGALGGCLRDLEGSSRSCGGSSLTPFFASLFAEASLSPSKAAQLPYSFPLFPSALVLSILGSAVTLAGLATPNFPRRRSPGGFEGRQSVSLVALGSSVATLALGLSTTLAQWSTLTKIAERADGVEVEIGSGFKLLWVAWSLMGLAVVGWGVQGREKQEQEGSGSKDEKSVL